MMFISHDDEDLVFFSSRLFFRCFSTASGSWSTSSRLSSSSPSTISLRSGTASALVSSVTFSSTVPATVATCLRNSPQRRSTSDDDRIPFRSSPPGTGKSSSLKTRSRSFTVRNTSLHTRSLTAYHRVVTARSPNESKWLCRPKSKYLTSCCGRSATCAGFHLRRSLAGDRRQSTCRSVFSSKRCSTCAS